MESDVQWLSDGEIDLLAAGNSQELYLVYEKLRKCRPVYRLVDGSYAISRYDDVKFALTHSDLFAAAWDKLPMLSADWLSADCRRGFGLAAKNPPEHHKYRAAINEPFTRAAIDQSCSWINDLARRYVQEIKVGTGLDFVADFANPFIDAILGRLTGLSESEIKHSRVCLAITDSLTNECPEPREKARIEGAFREQIAYLTAAARRRRQQPQADWASLIGNATVDGELFSDREIGGFMTAFVTGGFDPTAQLVSAVGLLGHNRPLFQLLRASPQKIPAFIEEVLRYENFTQALARATTAEVVMHGVTIPPDSIVMLLTGSANRDPAQFPNPDEFQLDRTNIKAHFGFGYGPHMCLGNWLVRLIMRVALENLLASFDKITGPPADRLQWSSTIITRTLKSLPIRFQ